MRPRLHGEDGASLLIALAFLSLFGLLVPALLNLGITDLEATGRLREQRTDVYTADGATDGAIQYLRTHSSCGRPIAGSCPISQFQYSDPVAGITATTTWQYVGNGFDFDRTLYLTTTEGAVTRVTARVIFRDSIPNAGGAPVDVVNWTYRR